MELKKTRKGGVNLGDVLGTDFCELLSCVCFFFWGGGVPERTKPYAVQWRVAEALASLARYCWLVDG